MTRWLQSPIVGALIVTGVLASPLLAGNPTYTIFLTTCLIWGVFAISFDLAFGLTGIMSFGHAAFFGVGAYTVAIVGQATGWPLSALLLAALGVGFFQGLVVASIGARSGGVYFGLFTLGMAELVAVLISTRFRSVTGGADGLADLRQPEFPWTGVSGDTSFYLVTAALFALTLAGLAILRRSQFGRVLSAIRQNDVRAEQLGFNVRRYRVIVFALSAAGSAMAGALLGSKMTYASPQLLDWGLSADVLLMCVIGGSGTLLGPLVGVLLVEAARELLSASTLHWSGLLGLSYVLVSTCLPMGLMGAFAPWLARASRGGAAQ